MSDNLTSVHQCFHTFAIEFEAARALFNSIGFDEQAAKYEKMANEQLAELKMSNILAVGY
jgi:hypothetical protein